MAVISDYQKPNITVEVIQPAERSVVVPKELSDIVSQKIGQLRNTCEYISNPPRPQHVDTTQIHQKRIQRLDEIEREINELKEDYLRNPRKYKAINISSKISLIAFPIIGIVVGSMIGLLLGYGLGKLWKDSTIATRVVFAAIGGVIGFTGLTAISLSWYFLTRNKTFRKHYCKFSDDTYHSSGKYIGLQIYLTDKNSHYFGYGYKRNQESGYGYQYCNHYEKFTVNDNSLCREGEGHIDGVLGELQATRLVAIQGLENAKRQDSENLQRKDTEIQQTVMKKTEWVRTLKEDFERELQSEFTGLTFQVEVFQNVLNRVRQRQPMLESAKGLSDEPLPYDQSLASGSSSKLLYPTMTDSPEY